jgi:hypothetical protein
MEYWWLNAHGSHMICTHVSTRGHVRRSSIAATQPCTRIPIYAAMCATANPDLIHETMVNLPAGVNRVFGLETYETAD